MSSLVSTQPDIPVFPVYVGGAPPRPCKCMPVTFPSVDQTEGADHPAADWYVMFHIHISFLFRDGSAQVKPLIEHEWKVHLPNGHCSCVSVCSLGGLNRWCIVQWTSTLLVYSRDGPQPVVYSHVGFNQQTHNQPCWSAVLQVI